ncbi:MAG: hypothetical protein RSC36_06485 [Ruthenibacterium sp.]
MQDNPQKTRKLGIGFATGRKSFRKVLNAYIYNWKETKKQLPQAENVSLSLFVAYDLDYNNAQSTDFTNLSQEMVDAFDDIVFMGTKNATESLMRLTKNGQMTEKELRGVFGAGYAGKRNAILYAALENHVDFLLFLDDDEYPVAVTNNKNCCLWSGQAVLSTHLAHIASADLTNGYHCGYISPIPNISFGSTLPEADFRAFIESISNDIINWDNVRRLMDCGGVTYADTAVLTGNRAEPVLEENGCKFISGANLCINLTKPERVFPFYNPPGARGEDTFLSTLLHERTVTRVDCYTFHDGFSAYRHLLDGVLPIHLEANPGATQGITNRFLSACVGWVRYKPLLVYLTHPDTYEAQMVQIRQTLERTLPKLAAYFDNERFMTVLTEFDRYRKNVKNHCAQFRSTQEIWQKLVQTLL